MKLKDKTGEIEAKVWDNVEELNRLCKKGDFVYVRSRAVSYRNMTQLTLLDLRPALPDEVGPYDFFPTIEGDIDTLYDELAAFMEGIDDPHLQKLLHAFFDEEEFRERFKYAPAAKGFHHNCLGGLLEHTLTVTRIMNFILDLYPSVKRNLALTGAILHDIGKVYEFSYSGLIDYTDEGRLIGHILMGVEMIDQKVATLKDFPPQLALELRHIIASHHGELEFGSPKRPKTMEALLVHEVDDLDAKTNAFQEYIKNAADNGSPWTPYHRLLDRFIYKGLMEPE